MCMHVYLYVCTWAPEWPIRSVIKYAGFIWSSFKRGFAKHRVNTASDEVAWAPQMSGSRLWGAVVGQGPAGPRRPPYKHLRPEKYYGTYGAGTSGVTTTGRRGGGVVIMTDPPPRHPHTHTHSHPRTPRLMASLGLFWHSWDGTNPVGASEPAVAQPNVSAVWFFFCFK